jgi:hypothetical protein
VVLAEEPPPPSRRSEYDSELWLENKSKSKKLERCLKSNRRPLLLLEALLDVPLLECDPLLAAPELLVDASLEVLLSLDEVLADAAELLDPEESDGQMPFT